MFKEIESAVSDHRMFDGKKRVIVALSGGADSMCLLHYLVSNCERFGVSVCAAHLNHSLRGEESERDNVFAGEMCRKLGVEFFFKKCDISSMAKEKKIGLEECGRQERYKFFDELCDDETVVATAHTASDNAETILLNITRGCGIDGLVGIPPVRGNIVRPLIRCSRTQIEKYCEENNVPFVTDSTNLTDEYNRNKIRLSVLPVLKKINPSAEASINRLSEIAAEKVGFLNRSVSREYLGCKTEKGLSLPGLQACDEDILPDVIITAVREHFFLTAEKKHIDLIVRAVREGSGAVEIRKDKFVRVAGNEVVFESVFHDAPREKFEERELKLSSQINYNRKKYIISSRKPKSDLNSPKINKKLLNKLLSCDIISCDTVIRTRRSGDFFKPVSRNCTKTLKKLFTEMKIPSEKRNMLLLIAKGSEILWIEGIGTSQTAIPKKDEDYFEIIVEGNDSE